MIHDKFGLSHIQYISTENLYILMNKHVKYEKIWLQHIIILIYNIVGYAMAWNKRESTFLG